ncbi:hypothetical protein RIF29_20903 [Crotalaria pallida]|uniref:Uncharacterized protein n=1 Tax=Crotalaria pallida TaxID=3830 RepID=A0AAN9I927_CROPI
MNRSQRFEHVAQQFQEASVHAAQRFGLQLLRLEMQDMMNRLVLTYQEFTMNPTFLDDDEEIFEDAEELYESAGVPGDGGCNIPDF